MTIKKQNFNKLYFFSAWAIFVVFHIVCITIDWSLRDHASQIQPMPGGIPDFFHSLIFFGSVIALVVTGFISLPKLWSIWLRFLFALIQFAIAYLIIITIWLYYVLNNGIDTL